MKLRIDRVFSPKPYLFFALFIDKLFDLWYYIQKGKHTKLNESKKRDFCLRIVNENAVIKQPYDIEDYKKFVGTSTIVQGTVVSYIVDEGVTIDLGNDVKGYILPFNFDESSISPKNTIISFMGKKIMAYVDSVENDTVYLNRVALQIDYKVDILNHLKVGTILDTKVLSIAPFGVFVDLGYGILGLLPISDISIARFSNINDVFSKGDNIKVIFKGQGETGYIVSHKELLGTWEENLSEFRIGEYCQGIVREIKPYGAFIELNPNLTGLAEIPQGFSVKVGDTVCIKLKSVNAEKLKVKLSLISLAQSRYKVKYTYKIQVGVMAYWRYTPEGSQKCIETVFE